MVNKVTGHQIEITARSINNGTEEEMFHAEHYLKRYEPYEIESYQNDEVILKYIEQVFNINLFEDYKYCRCAYCMIKDVNKKEEFKLKDLTRIKIGDFDFEVKKAKFKREESSIMFRAKGKIDEDTTLYVDGTVKPFDLDGHSDTRKNEQSIKISVTKKF